MTRRAEVLRRYGLPDVEAFDVKRETNDGVSHITISYKGGNEVLLGLSNVREFAETVRDVDPDLAEQVCACIREPRGDPENRG